MRPCHKRLEGLPLAKSEAIRASKRIQPWWGQVGQGEDKRRGEKGKVLYVIMLTNNVEEIIKLKFHHLAILDVITDLGKSHQWILKPLSEKQSGNRQFIVLKHYSTYY